MLKRFGFAALSAVMLFVAGVTVATQPAQAATTDQAPTEAPAPKTDAGIDALNLALKAITLSQGEKGVEVWRLKATWAGMAQKDGQITVQKPRLTYFTPPDNQELHVDADTGDIDQKNQILRFVGNVTAQMDDRLLSGALMVYTGQEKTMTFPSGAVFHDSDMSGSAQQVTWRMNDRTVEAEGEVEVIFEQSPSDIMAKPGKE